MFCRAAPPAAVCASCNDFKCQTFARMSPLIAAYVVMQEDAKMQRVLALSRAQPAKVQEAVQLAAGLSNTAATVTVAASQSLMHAQGPPDAILYDYGKAGQESAVPLEG